MNSWIETGMAVIMALIGCWLGKRIAFLPKYWWMTGFFLPMTVIVLYGLAWRAPALGVSPPLAWLSLGRAKFAVMGLVTATMLTTLMIKSPRRRDRFALAVLMFTFVSGLSIWPYLAPALNHRLLASLSTKFNPEGVCLQSTDYTCGPAAAVTALKQLGLSAEEGQLAIWAHTSSAIGTPPDILADTLQEHYGAQGLRARYVPFQSIDELQAAGLTIVVVKFGLMLDHYVTVLDVNATQVIVADPLAGIMKYSRPDFEDKWRRLGVVLDRPQPGR